MPFVTHSRRQPCARLARLGLILALLIGLLAQPAAAMPAATAAALPAVPAATLPAAPAAALPAAALRNADGTLNTRTGASGAVDLRGWDVTLDATRGPLFAPAGSPAARPAAVGWNALGTGLNDMVNAIAISGTAVYAGGYFTTAGNGAANYIAKWDGAAWSALGAGLDSPVNAIAISGSDLYVGGRFFTAGGVRVNFIAKWDGTAWSALGAGLNNIVWAIAINGSDLYAGGAFTSPANRIAKWDGAAWSALGTGLNNRTVNAIAISGSAVYAGGTFSTDDGDVANRIAKWNGAAWSKLGWGLDSTVYAIASSGSDLYAGGSFTTAGGVDANHIAKWDGAAWSALGAGLSDTVGTIAISGTAVYAGGNFTTAGGVTANHIAQWDGAAWSALGTGLDNYVRTIAISGSDLYVGGDFSTAGSVAANRIARYGASSAPVICTATGSGNWSNPATWSCGHMPGPGEAVVIAAGHTVTLDQDVALDSNLDVQGTLVPNGKTVTLTGSAAQTLTGNPLTFYNLVVNKTNATDTVTVVGKLKVTKKLTIIKGKLKSASDYGDVEIGPDGTLELTSDITVGGNWTNNGTFTHGNQTVEFDGTTLQTLAGTNVTPFYRWVITTTAQVFISDTVPTVASDMENNGSLSQTQTVSGNTLRISTDQTQAVSGGSPVNFLQISTDKYRGVDITTTDDLGAVTVSISGNHATCTGDANSPPYRNRCIRIDAASGNTGDSSITAYTTVGEDDVTGSEDLYQYPAPVIGGWFGTSATCGSNAGDSCTASSVTLEAGANYFLIGGEASPTAITLQSFRAAAPTFDPAAWFANLLRQWQH